MRHQADHQNKYTKFNMGYILIGLALLVIVKVYAGGDDDILNETCLQFLDPEQMDKNVCCNSLEAFYEFDDGAEECMKDDPEEWKCEIFQCVLRKNDMLKDDKVDEDGAKKFFDKVEKTIPNEKAVIDRVRNECLNGKYEIYPPEDVCPAIKFYICIYLNVIMGCSSWKTDETCSKIAEDAEKCRSSLKNE